MRWAATRFTKAAQYLVPGVEGLVGDGTADDSEECCPGDAEPLQQVRRGERGLHKGEELGFGSDVESVRRAS